MSNTEHKSNPLHFTQREYNVSATNNKKIIHIGSYADETTANRVINNIQDFCPAHSNWQVIK